MQGLTIETVAKACDGQIFYSDCEQKKWKDHCLTGVEIDSRKLVAGNLFIATRGERVDGHSFIPEAFEKGCMAVVCEELPKEKTGPCILVEDSFLALKQIAAYYRSLLKIPVVGITGSVGKTSTKEVIATVLSEKFSVLKTEANYNNEVGLPLTILLIREEHQIAVLEMGINHFGEMTRLSAIARPDVCVITNIGPCHLEFLGDLDGVLQAKTEMFQNLKQGATVCLNGDDQKLQSVEKVQNKKPVFFGFGENNDIRVKEIENKGLFGSTALLMTKEESITFSIPVPGEHMIKNCACAAAVGLQFGMSLREIAEGIAHTKALQGRSRVVEGKDIVIIDDCYNANPLSMKSALSLLETAKSRKVAILGDMFELGEREVELHKEVGEYAAQIKLDLLICIGNLSKNLYETAKKGTFPCYYFSTKEEFIKEIDNLLQVADTVLLKASNGMQFSSLVEFCLHHTWS